MVMINKGIWARYRAKGGYKCNVNVPVGNEWFKSVSEVDVSYYCLPLAADALALSGL